MTSSTSIAPPTTSTTEPRHGRQRRATHRGVSALMYAAQQGEVQHVKKILRVQPTAILERDRTGKSPLHYCCTSNNLSAAQTADLLVMAAPDLVDNRDEDGFTPLHLAVIAGNMPLVTFLIANGADVRAVDNEKHTVVHWATVCGETAALQAVLAAGAPVSTPDVHGGYPLHYAAQMCGGEKDFNLGMQVLQILLNHNNDIDVSVEDVDGRQPLLWAASAGSAKAILALIRAGAIVESCDKDGLTALHCAASRGHTDCIDCLLTLCGASPDVIDSNGCTALHYAVTLGHADATALLLAHGSDPNRQDRKGRSPAHCGCAKGQFETVKMIGAHGANLWLKNAYGNLPLHEAAASGRRDLVKWLLEMRPSQVNARNNDGRCPLHLAALNDNADICKILLDAGAQINPILRTSKNVFMTPLDCALQRGFRSTAKFLQLHGGIPASRLSESKQNIKMSSSFKVREETPKIMNDTSSSDSERESKKVLHQKKKINKKEKNGVATSEKALRVNNHEKFKRVEADSINLTKRNAYKSRRLDYSNEIIINGNTEINIHQTSEIITTNNGGPLKARSIKSFKTPNGVANIINIKEDGGVKITTAAEEIKEKVAKNQKLSFDSKSFKNNIENNLPDQLMSTISNTREEVDGQKKLVTEAAVHSPPREKQDMKDLREDNDQKESKKIISSKDKKEEKPDNGQILMSNKSEVTEDVKNLQTLTDKKDAYSKKLQEIELEKSKEEIPDEEITKIILAGTSHEITEEIKGIEEDNKGNSVKTSSDDNQNEVKPTVEVVSNVYTVNEKSTRKDDDVDEIIAKELIECSEKLQEKKLPEDSNQIGEIVDRSNLVLTSSSANETNRIAETESRKEETFDVNQIKEPDEQKKNSESKAADLAESNQQGDKEELALFDNKMGKNKDSVETVIENQITSTLRAEPVPKSSSIVKKQDLEIEEEEKQKKNDKDNTEDKPSLSKNKDKTINNNKDQQEPTNKVKDEKNEQDRHQLEPSIRSHKNKKFVKTKTIQSSEDELSTQTDFSTSSSTGTVKEHKSFRVLDEEEADKLKVTDKSQLNFVLRRKKIKKSKIPTPTSKHSLKSGSYLEVKKNKNKSYMDSRVPSLPNIHHDDENNKEIAQNNGLKITEINKSAPNLTSSIYSLSEKEEFEERNSGKRKRLKKRSKQIRESKSAGSDYESSNIIDSGFEPSPRNSRIPKWKNISERGVNMSSVTKSIQSNIRRYHLERKIFQHLLDLKRLQIRADQHNEALLVKRAIDTYNQSCASTIGAGRYIPEDYTFKSFEKFLYLSLRKLQKNCADYLKELPSESENPLLCTKSTHRCMHTTHAYTGIPCAAYLPKMDHHTIPKIGFNSTNCKPGTGGSSLFLPTINLKKAVTLELCHGNDKQVISLPADRLDQNKRYYVTFTVKGNDDTITNNNSTSDEQTDEGHKHSKSD